GRGVPVQQQHRRTALLARIDPGEAETDAVAGPERDLLDGGRVEAVLQGPQRGTRTDPAQGGPGSGTGGSEDHRWRSVRVVVRRRSRRSAAARANGPSSPRPISRPNQASQVSLAARFSRSVSRGSTRMPSIWSRT